MIAGGASNGEMRGSIGATSGQSPAWCGDLAESLEMCLLDTSDGVKTARRTLQWRWHPESSTHANEPTITLL